MKKTVLLFLLVPLAVFAAADQCMECHRQLKESKFLEHNYADWKKSVHGRAEIPCHACHGGHPDTKDPVKAHQGVLSSKNRLSSVHFQKIPQTCGQCHAAEFSAFQKSIHYKMLERSGKGPNCLTCHGSMATTVLSYSDLENTCSLCHGKPVQAGKALSLIHSMKELLRLHAKKLPASFGERFEKIRAEWHSFNVTVVVEEGQKWIKEVKEVLKKK